MIKIGEINVDVQIKFYRDEQDSLKEELQVLQYSTIQLKEDCEQYIDYASDAEERETIVNNKSALEAQIKRASTAQIESIGKEVVKLERLAKELH